MVSISGSERILHSPTSTRLSLVSIEPVHKLHLFGNCQYHWEDTVLSLVQLTCLVTVTTIVMATSGLTRSGGRDTESRTLASFGRRQFLRSNAAHGQEGVPGGEEGELVYSCWWRGIGTQVLVEMVDGFGGIFWENCWG
jgi:hypothetical protein